MEAPPEYDEKSSGDSLEALQAGSEEVSVRGWCTLVGGWLATFASFGYISSFGVYQDLYTRSGTSSSSNISWIGSVQLFFFVVTALPAGALTDKGYFRHVVLAGSLILTFSLFMLSLAHVDQYYQLLLSQGVGMGIGSGLLYLPAMAVQAQHWKNRRSFAMGVVITGSSVGGIVYPIMLNHLFHGASSVGFAWGVRSSAFLTLGVLVLANLLMSPRPVKPHDVVTKDTKPNARDFLNDLPYMFTIYSSFIFILGFLFPFFYLQVFTILEGLPPNFAFYTLTIQNGAGILGRTIPNLFADKFGVMNMQLLVFLGTGISIFGMFGVTNVGGVIVFAIFYGFFSGGALSSFAPATSSFARVPSEVGLRMGFAYAATSLAWLTGPPILGALVGDEAHWSKAIIFGGITSLAGFSLLLVGRHVQAKRKNSPYV